MSRRAQDRLYVHTSSYLILDGGPIMTQEHESPESDHEVFQVFTDFV